MKSQIALILLGYVAIATASGYASLVRKPAPLPVPSNYVPPPQAAPAPLPADEYVVAPVAEEPKVVVYKAPIRQVTKQPIRVSASVYGDDEASHGGHGGQAQKQRGGYAAGGAGGSLTRKQEQEILDEEYASNAQYSFTSAIDDGIMDQSQHREETRDGKKVSGSYSYSDGYYMRTVIYEADENGYRVVGGSVEPIRESGPEVDLKNGKAEVLTQIGGVDTQYTVSADELALAAKRQAALLKENSY